MTNSERRVQRVRKALDPPGEARDDTWIIAELARRLGHDWGQPDAEEVWDELRSLSPMHARHELRPARGARRHPVAVPRRGAPGLAVPARAALGRAARGPAGAVLASSRHKPPVRGARRRVPDPAHHRPAARVVQHRRADEPLPLAAAPRRVARPLARGRRAAAARGRRDRARLVAPRLGRGAGAHRPVAAARARVHDLPLPGPGRHEPADDRRHRPEVGHGRVQGGRDPGREARAAPSARQRAASPSRPPSAGRPRWTCTSLDAEPTAAERAAVDARARPAARRLGRRRARARAGRQHARAAATRRARAATCCCRRCSRCRSGSAGSAPAR